jgi:hypothetical protein
MTIVGIFIGGASNMIGAACAADLGKAAIDLGMSSVKGHLFYIKLI